MRSRTLRSDERTAQRNGHKERSLKTLVGDPVLQKSPPQQAAWHLFKNKLPINLCSFCLRMNFMRVESLNIFRFIAAIIIINFHFTHLYPGFLTSGPEMVTFFFVLSGAVLILAHYDDENFSSKNFFLRRITKLYPSYLVALAMVIAWYSTIPLDISIEKFLMNLLALQAWFPSHPLDLNFPAWAISVEVLFYLSFPIILYKLKKNSLNPYYIVLSAMVFWAITQIIIIYFLNSSFYIGEPSVLHDILFNYPLSHFSSFSLGIAIGYLAEKCDFELPKTTAYSFFIFSLIIIYFICENQKAIDGFLGLNLPFESSFMAPFMGLFILANILNNKHISKYFSNKFFIILGASSYQLYIFQYPIFIVYNKYLSNKYLFFIIYILFSISSYFLLNSIRKKLTLDP